MGGFDVLAFTGGIGENSASMRRRICDRLEFLGLDLDEDKNAALQLDNFAAPQIQQAYSRIRVFVTQTRETWMIAREVYQYQIGSASGEERVCQYVSISVVAVQLKKKKQKNN